MRFLLFLFFQLLFQITYPQFTDTLIKGKLVNYGRKYSLRELGFKSSFMDKELKSNFGTMNRLTITDPNSGLAEQIVFINGKKNGLSVAYWWNGIVKSVNYYFEGKLWETISAADVSGKLLHPGTLTNGNGLVYDYNNYGEIISITTYRNGLPEGPFKETVYKPFLNGYSCNPCITEGTLSYKPSVVNYFPAFRFRYIDHGDTIPQIVDTATYYRIIVNKEYFPFEVLDLKPDSMQQSSAPSHYLGIEFSDPAVIPTGKWKVFDGPNKKELVAEIEHDDNGNPIHFTTFKNGEKIIEIYLPPCSKRKIQVENYDGSFKEEKCLDNK